MRHRTKVIDEHETTVSQFTQNHDDDNRERGIRGLRPYGFLIHNTDAEKLEVVPVYTHSCGKRLKIVREVAQPNGKLLFWVSSVSFWKMFSEQRGIEKQKKNISPSTFLKDTAEVMNK